MARYWRVLALIALALPVFGAPRLELSEFRQRREALRQALGEGALVILPGATEAAGGDLRNGFFQEQNFYYLTGWTEPGAMLVMTPKSDILLLPKRNKKQEQWTGPKAAPGDAGLASLTGFEHVQAVESLEASLPQWLQDAQTVYTRLGTPEADSLQRAMPMRTLRSAEPTLEKLRRTKSPAEIAMIQFTTDVNLEAHRNAWKAIQPGKYEYEIAAIMSATYFGAGCERHAYAPIVGSGPNAAILHYSKNKRQMDAGELALMDVGAECAMYATDITRTVPVNGKFTPRQRELYDVVLGAQKAALAAVKPGVMLGHSSNKVGLHKIALDYIDSHGKDLHGNSLGKYFIHGLGHHVGLDVHDGKDYSTPLEEGMIITLEPGIYIPEEKIGIRIEDMVLVTKDGGRLLSGALPREADDIERFMAEARQKSKQK